MKNIGEFLSVEQRIEDFGCRKHSLAARPAEPSAAAFSRVKRR
jgi:hypothetical protein